MTRTTFASECRSVAESPVEYDSQVVFGHAGQHMWLIQQGDDRFIDRRVLIGASAATPDLVDRVTSTLAHLGEEVQAACRFDIGG